MPAVSTIQREIITNEAFSAQYRRARANAGDFWADRISEVTEGVLDGKHEPQAARVAMPGMQWLAAKMNPKVYGDHQTLDVNAQVHHRAAEGAPTLMQAALGRLEERRRRKACDPPSESRWSLDQLKQNNSTTHHN